MSGRKQRFKMALLGHPTLAGRRLPRLVVEPPCTRQLDIPPAVEMFRQHLGLLFLLGLVPTLALANSASLQLNRRQEPDNIVLIRNTTHYW